MATRHLVGPVILGAAVLATGCATKSFVKEEIGRTETKVGQVNQQVERLEGELGQEKTRLTAVATQATEARTTAEQATARATEAGTRAAAAHGRADEAATKAAEASGVANQALARAGETDTRLTKLWAGRHRRALGDTVVVQFGFDRWALDDRAQTSLLDLVKQLQEIPELTVELEGYTDTSGAAPYNLTLSQRRAEAVRRFLVEKGVELHRIAAIGLGDVRPMGDNKTKQGRDQNRRVAIKVYQPAN